MMAQPFFVPAILLLVAAIPLALGWIPRNRVYGIRTRKTLSDEDVWHRSNRFGGWMVICSGTTYLFIAAAYPVAGPGDADFALWLIHLGAFALPLIIAVFSTLLYTRSL